MSAHCLRSFSRNWPNFSGAAQQVGDDRGRATVGRVRHLHAQLIQHGLGDQVVGNAHTGGAVGGGRRLLEVVLQLGQVVGRHVLVDDDHVGLHRGQRDGREVGRLVAGALGVEHVGDGHGAGRGDADGVAIGLRLRQAVRHDVAARARQVLDHDRLAQALRQRLGQQARQRVGGAAGRETDQQAHRLGRLPGIRGHGRRGRQGADDEQCARGALQTTAEHEVDSLIPVFAQASARRHDSTAGPGGPKPAPRPGACVRRNPCNA